MNAQRRSKYLRWHARAEHAVEHEQPTHDPPLCPHDEAVFLLHSGAEVEHALMVQYLYAAYSLKEPEDLPPEHQPKVRKWKRILLGIAREEMGHLITVQNLLKLIGGPINLEREDYPFRSDLYPFHFRLEPISRASLAKYIVAEMPHIPDPDGEIKEIIERATNASQMPVNRVGAVYMRIADILSEPRTVGGSGMHISRADFLGDVASRQAQWSDWGAEGSILIPRITNRQEALAAIDELAEQGEGMFDSTAAPSHFQRFLSIYREFPEEGDWEPAYMVSTDPSTEPERAPASDNEDEIPTGRITHPGSRVWAQLANVRYRLLLNYLSHFLLTEGPLIDDEGNRTPRGYLQKWTFDEMRRVGRLASWLATLPRFARRSDLPHRAGIPFELPYTLALPDREADRWRSHLDVLATSGDLVREIVRMRWHGDDRGETFLSDLTHFDNEAQQVMQTYAFNDFMPPRPEGFKRVVQMLEEAVRGFQIGVHHNFWRGRTRDEFVEMKVFGLPLIARTEDGRFDGRNSNLVKALLGEPPFDAPPGSDDRSRFPRMPAHRPPIPAAWIDYIVGWINAGCPDSHPPGQVGTTGERNASAGAR